MKPNLRVVDSEQPHSRDIARCRIKEWKSNAAKENLPVVNVVDDKGGRRLDTDDVLRRSEPGRARK